MNATIAPKLFFMLMCAALLCTACRAGGHIERTFIDAWPQVRYKTKH